MRLDLNAFMDDHLLDLFDGFHITIEQDHREEDAYAFIIQRIREMQDAEDQ